MDDSSVNGLVAKLHGKWAVTFAGRSSSSRFLLSITQQDTSCRCLYQGTSPVGYLDIITELHDIAQFESWAFFKKIELFVQSDICVYESYSNMIKPYGDIYEAYSSTGNRSISHHMNLNTLLHFYHIDYFSYTKFQYVKFKSGYRFFHHGYVYLYENYMFFYNCF